MISNQTALSFTANHLKHYIKEGKLEISQSKDQALSDQLFELSNLFYIFSNPDQLKKDSYQLKDQNKSLEEIENDLKNGTRASLTSENTNISTRIDIQGDKIILTELMKNSDPNSKTSLICSTSCFSPDDFNSAKLKANGLSKDQLQKRTNDCNDKIHELYNKVIQHFKDLYLHHIKAKRSQSITKEDKEKMVESYKEITKIFSYFEGMVR